MASKVLPRGGTTTYHYDNARLCSFENQFEEVTSYTYDGLGRIVRRDLDNGAHTSYTYNNRGWITGVQNIKRDGSTVLSSFNYYYTDGDVQDKAGNILKTMQTLSDSNTYTATYRYDDINRLTYEGRTGPQSYGYSYSYDGLGNREQMDIAGDGSTIYTYDLDANSQMDTEWSGATTNTYSYDGRGNTITKAVSGGGATSYTYDDRSRLVSIEYPSAGGTAEFTYNTAGVRTKRVSAAGTTRYHLYSGTLPLMEFDSSGDIVAAYTIGPDGIVSEKLGASSYYLACDASSSVWNLATLDSSETRAATYSYTAFGSITISDTDNTGNALKYAGAVGAYTDPGQADFVTIGAKFYSSSAGRWLTQSNSMAALEIDDPTNDDGSRYPGMPGPSLPPIDELGPYLGPILEPEPVPGLPDDYQGVGFPYRLGPGGGRIVGGYSPTDKCLGIGISFTCPYEPPPRKPTPPLPIDPDPTGLAIPDPDCDRPGLDCYKCFPGGQPVCIGKGERKSIADRACAGYLILLPPDDY